MAKTDFDHLKYVNRHARSDLFRRLAWSVVYSLLFRPTPRWTMHGWRRLLLRLFGAQIGSGSKVAPTCRVFAPWNLVMGQRSVLAEGVDCYCVDLIQIGSMVAVSQRTYLCTASHDITSLRRELTHHPIRIDNHAWICAEAFVGPGVTVGEGAVVGARAFVVRDVEPWVVVGPAPASVIKKRVVAEIAEDLE